ncbi:MAG: hypothetical protein JO101_06680 [Candidatus Eremiobacteraeota bacterium]|nr:hypothetical protein [Candidatus Eremiobacteraeota bacterium]
MCLDNEDYRASLELHKVYLVLQDALAKRNGMIRVIDESGEDYLYDSERFAPIKVSPAVKAAILESSAA